MERRKSGCCVFSRIELDEEPEEKVAARWLSSATADDRNKWMATHGAEAVPVCTKVADWRGIGATVQKKS